MKWKPLAVDYEYVTWQSAGLRRKAIYVVHTVKFCWGPVTTGKKITPFSVWEPTLDQFIGISNSFLHPSFWFSFCNVRNNDGLTLFHPLFDAFLAIRLKSTRCSEILTVRYEKCIELLSSFSLHSQRFDRSFQEEKIEISVWRFFAAYITDKPNQTKGERNLRLLTVCSSAISTKLYMPLASIGYYRCVSRKLMEIAPLSNSKSEIL